LRNPYTGVLSHFAHQLLIGKDLAIFEDGEIARDFVFVDDVVDALLRAGDRALPHGSIVDIGSGYTTTILRVTRILQRELNCHEAVLRITSEFRVGDIRHACANIENAKRLLGWSPSVGIEEGLSQLALWARREHKAAFSEN
jgi:dTDP-L-rhamnose 4-epimerase